MSGNIRTDAIELLCTKEDFIELMDDNAKLCAQVERLTARCETNRKIIESQRIAYGQAEGRIAKLEDQAAIDKDFIKQYQRQVAKLEASLHQAYVDGGCPEDEATAMVEALDKTGEIK